jgi:hypothetical protein
LEEAKMREGQLTKEIMNVKRDHESKVATLGNSSENGPSTPKMSRIPSEDTIGRSSSFSSLDSFAKPQLLTPMPPSGANNGIVNLEDID